MPTYTVELTYIQCVAVEASSEEEAIAVVLNMDDLPYPEVSEVTDVELTDEDD